MKQDFSVLKIKPVSKTKIHQKIHQYQITTNL